MPQDDWRKLYRVILSDEKCRLLLDGQWRLFVSLILLGCRDEDRAGEILHDQTRRPMSLREIADEIGMTKSAVERALKRLLKWKMVSRPLPSRGRFPATLRVENFGKYQSLRPTSGTEEACVPRAGHNEADEGGLRPTSGTQEDPLRPTSGTQSGTQPPTEPQECASESVPRSTSRSTSRDTSTSKATTSTDSSANSALGLDGLEPEQPISEARPANTEKAQLVQELWEVFGYEGSPPSKKPAAYSGAIRLVDGKFAVARELIAHLKRSPPQPEEGETPGAFFLATLKTMLAAPPGVGWRKPGAPWQTEVPPPPPEDDPNRLSFRR